MVTFRQMGRQAGGVAIYNAAQAAADAANSIPGDYRKWHGLSGKTKRLMWFLFPKLDLDKATSLSSLGVAGIAANFSSKATIQDITNPLNPISIDGNATLQLWLTDNGEPGSSETFGIQVINKSGGSWFSSS